MGNIEKVLIFNFAVIAIFVALAYFFGKWWICLIALLFTMTHAENVYPVEILMDEQAQEEEDENTDE